MQRLSGGDNSRRTKLFFAIATATALAIAGSSGCSHQAARVAAPTLDAKAAADAAIAEYDTNHDGMISGKELDHVPGLKVALGRLGKGSGKISAEAIADEIRAWQETKIALTNLGVSVTLDGQPLAGATVTAEPEKFLGPTILPASGVTDHTGSPRCGSRENPAWHLVSTKSGFRKWPAATRQFPLATTPTPSPAPKWPQK